jgi:transposase
VSWLNLAVVVKAAGTTLTEIFGAGPVVAATVIGGVVDVSRFPGRDHFAAYNGTAPIEVSSGNRKIYRLSRRGNRRLNHAVHMAAVTQIRHRHGNGRAYYDRKLAEGKTSKEALRSLKRRSAMPSSPASRPAPAGPQLPAPRAREGNRRTTLTPARPVHTPKTGSSAKPLPDLNPHYDPLPSASAPSRRSELQRTPVRPLDNKEASMPIAPIESVDAFARQSGRCGNGE